MVWLLFAFVAPVLWAVSTHIDKYLVDRYFDHGSVAALLVLTGIVGLMLALPIWLLIPGSFALPVTSILLIVAAGAASMLAMQFYLEALQNEEASVVVPWFQFTPVFGYGLAYLLLGETLTSHELLGGAAIIAGALVLSVEGRGQGGRLRLAVLMLTSAFILSGSTVIFKLFALRDAFWPVTAWTGIGQAVFGASLLRTGTTRSQLRRMFGRDVTTITTVNIVNEVINLGGALAQRYALTLAPLSLVQAIGGTGPLFVFLIGAGLTVVWPALEQEDLSPPRLAQKAVAAILVMVGVALVSG